MFYLYYYILLNDYEIDVKRWNRNRRAWFKY